MPKITTMNDIKNNTETATKPIYPNWAEVQRWRGFAKRIGDADALLPVPLNPESKTPAYGVLTAKSHPEADRWCWKKMKSWKTDLTENQVGVLLQGNIGVLDFDDTKSWEWFKTTFQPDLSKYVVVETDKGAHLYFTRTNDTSRHTKYIVYEDGERTNIDHLTHWENGTPSLVVVPNTNSNKKFITSPDDLTSLATLPLNFIDYSKSHRWVAPDRGGNGKRSDNYIKLASVVPPDHELPLGQWQRCVRELRSMGCSFDDVYGWSSKLAESKKFSPAEHKSYLRNYWNIIEVHTLVKSSNLLNSRAIGYNETLYKKWINNTLTEGTNKFERTWVQLLANTRAIDIPLKKHLLMNYYDKFFCFTTGEGKNAYYSRDYRADGKLKSITEFQDQGSFFNFANVSISITQDAEGNPGKPIKSAQYWATATSNSFHKCVFRPYGMIKPEYDPDVFNTFPGYNIQFQSTYKDASSNLHGDNINTHLRKVLCNDNEEVYNFTRRWIYDLVCLGKRPKVMLVFYSPEMGTGKSMWWSNFCKFVIGDDLASTNGSFTKMMKDTFTDYMDNVSLMLIEELPEHSHRNKDIWEQIKSLITDDKGSKRGFMKAPKQGENWISLVCLTNNFTCIDPDVLVRRIMATRVSAEMMSNTEYFTHLATSTEQYEGWSNFIHRYIIGAYEQELSNVVVLPNASCIPDTEYRKGLLRKRTDDFAYFFKEYLIDNPNFYDDSLDNPWENCVDKYLYIQELFQAYQVFVDTHNFPRWCETSEKFAQKLYEKLDCYIYAIQKEIHPHDAMYEKKKTKQVPKKRTKHGNAIHLTQDFLDKIEQTINTLCVGNDEEDIVLLDADTEHDDSDIFLNADYTPEANGYYKNTEGKYVSVDEPNSCNFLDNDD